MLEILPGRLFRPKREAARRPVPVEERLRFALDYQASGRQTEAEAIFRAVLEETPLNADVMHLLVSNLLLQRRHDEAELSYRRALQLRPDFAAWPSNPPASGSVSV